MTNKNLSKLMSIFCLVVASTMLLSGAAYAVTSNEIMAQYKHYNHKYDDPKKGVDCITMSNMLFNAHKKAGIPVRIIKYKSSTAKHGWHYTIQIKSSGKWVDANYNGFSSKFKPMKTKSGLTVVKSYS